MMLKIHHPSRKYSRAAGAALLRELYTIDFDRFD